MSDRELLELAAKAAGYTVRNHRMSMKLRSAPDLFVTKGDDINTLQWWNPLADDGDALRLAVSLDMLVDANEIMCSALTLADGAEQPVLDMDKYQATRRAIVRAAAAIGKGGESGPV